MPARITKGNYRPGSVRGPGLRVALDRHQVGNWLFSIGQRFGCDSTRFKAASALAAVIGHDGRLDPTHGWIAEKIEACVKTVVRALHELAELGFLTWQRRVAVTAGVEHQTSNAYQLRFPEATPASPETPEQLSTAPVSALSHNKEDSLSGEKELWDTPRNPDASPPQPARVPVPLHRAQREAAAALAKAREGSVARMVSAINWFGRKNVDGALKRLDRVNPGHRLAV